ncbi:hypothetical protein WG66_014916 [Moniliophthora roreri]|nr:hypothetical protein WG66_014916 [Moniliophthora roreri]
MGSRTSFDPQRRCLFLNTSLDDHFTFSSIVVGQSLSLGMDFTLRLERVSFHHTMACYSIGFYCIVEKHNDDTRIPISSCLLTLFILASINVPASTIRVTGCSAYGFYTLQHLDVPNLTTLSFVADTFADAILIFRCYAVRGSGLSIVIAPIIGCIAVEVLGTTMMGLLLRYGTDEPWCSRTTRGISAYGIANACMNILLTLMIAGRIWWIAREAREAQSLLSKRHFRRLKMISSLILGSGILFPIALVCKMLFNLSPSLSYGWDLKPLLIQVAGRRGLSDNEPSA